MFERLGSITFRFRFLVVLAWVVAAGLFGAFSPSLAGSGSTDQTTFLPATAQSVVSKNAIERAFPGSTASSSASITIHRDGGLTDADRQYLEDFAAWSMSAEAPKALSSVVTDTATADTRPELKELFRSEDGSFEMLLINLNVADAGDAAKAVVGLLREHLTETTPQGLEVHVTGASAISSDYLEAVQAGTDSTTVITVVLVILVLLAIYRAPLAALIPLLTIGVAFAVSRGILGFLAEAGWQVSSTLATFLVVMVFGVGTDYAIFLISRYREEVGHETDWHDAARITVRRIGAVIAASAGTVIVGMVAMGVGDFQMIASMGPGIAIAVAITLFANLTLSPSLLSIFGHYLFWPLHTREKHEGEPRGFFAALAGMVSRHPGITTVLMTALLLAPALYLPHTKSNFDVLADLPATADSRVGYKQIADSLGEDKLVQSTAMVATNDGSSVMTPAQLARLRDLMVSLHEKGGMATTTSIVTPEGDTVVPDGFTPSKTLATIGDGFAGDDNGDSGSSSGSGDSGGKGNSLLDDEVKDGLNQALDYVNGLGVAFPDVAAGTSFREARAGVERALKVVQRVRDRSVLSTQLRTLASSITDPANAASSTGSSTGSGDSSGDAQGDTLMSDYLAELGTAFPEVRSLPAYADAVAAARSLEQDASVGAALDLAKAYRALADHFEGSGAVLSPESLSSTADAKEIKAEATAAFDALPALFTSLSDVFASRPDDIWIPTSLTGDDAEKLQDAIDAFVSKDGSATRFYLTSASKPYSGGAFEVIRQARVVMAGAAPSFGPRAEMYIGGPIAQFTDVQDVLGADFQKVGILTVLGILIVLIVLLRAIVAPLYLVATVIVSYGSTIGITAFLFQEVLGQAGISPYLPLMVFVLLVALGSDYNIFLMHRVREEAERLPMRDAVRIASGHTGAVITSAGLILAGTFGSMVTAPLTILFQVGTAVAIGVLIDTFLVRSILVPAITALVGDKAWWPSGSALLHPQGVPAGSPEALPAPGGSPVPLGSPLGSPVPAGIAATWALGLDETDADVVAAAAAAGLTQGALAPVTGSGAAAGSSVVAASGAAGSPVAAASPVAVGSAVAAAGSPFAVGSAAAASSAVVVAPAAPVAVEGSGRSIRRLAGAVGLAILVPAFVAGLLTWSLGGQAANLADVRAAVVNLDEGATYPAADGTTSQLALGTDLAGSLTVADGDAGFTWETATADDAAAGLRDGTYAAVLTIPADFSRTVAALRADQTGAAPKATLNLATDDASSAQLGAAARSISAAISATTARGITASYVDDTLLAVTGAKAAVQSAVTQAQDVNGQAGDLSNNALGVKVVAGQMVAGLQQFADGIADSTDGTDKLISGTADLADGVNQLADGADELASGAKQASDGAASLATGAQQLADGLAALDGSTAALPAQASALATGVAGIASGTADLSTGISALAMGLQTMATQTTGYGASVTALDAGAQDLATGASGLASGAAAADSAATSLAAGASSAASGVSSYVAGVSSLSSSCLASGAAPAFCTQLANLAASGTSVASGVSDIATGLTGLTTATSGLASGASDLATGAAGLATGTQQLAAGGAALEGGIASSASGASDLADGASQLATGAAAAATGTQQLADGMPALASGISDLADGGAGLAAGVASYAAGMKALAGGAADLATGAGTAADGAQQLADGTAGAADTTTQLTDAVNTAKDAAKLVQTQTGNLADATDTLGSAAKDLADSLSGAAATLGSYDAATREKLGAQAADPVRLETGMVDVAAAADAGLAPFLLPIAIWLGVLGAFLVLPGLWWAGSRGFGSATAVSFGAAGTVAMGGALLAAAVLRVLVGVSVASLPMLAAFAVLTALAFTAVVQALVALLGQRGWLVALLLLVVQAAAAGYPYSPSAMPGFVAAIHPFLPMSYAVDALRGAISGGSWSPMLDTAFLVGTLTLGLIVTLAAAAGSAMRGTAGTVQAHGAGAGAAA